MGGRGASLSGNIDVGSADKFVQVSYWDNGEVRLTEYKKDGERYYHRDITDGKSEWKHSGIGKWVMLVNNAKIDQKNGAKTKYLDPNDKRVKNIISSSKRTNKKAREKDAEKSAKRYRQFLNGETKKVIKNQLAARKQGKPVDYANRDGLSRSKSRLDKGIVTYKGGKKVVNASYKKSRVDLEVSNAKSDLNDAAFRATMGGLIKPKAADLREIEKINRRISALNRQLR